VEFQPFIFIIGVVFNLIFCAVIYLVQQGEEEWGAILSHGFKIPETNQIFLHWQDFYCQKFGCTIGLSITTGMFTNLIMQLHLSFVIVACFILVFLVDIKIFNHICLGKRHKPDWGYPRIGRISIGGRVHLVYHGLNIAMLGLLVFVMIVGNLNGWPMWLTLISLVIYVITNVIDIKKGHFDQLKLL